jgi:hypothetical protein
LKGIEENKTLTFGDHAMAQNLEKLSLTISNFKNIYRKKFAI